MGCCWCAGGRRHDSLRTYARRRMDGVDVQGKICGAFVIFYIFLGLWFWMLLSIYLVR